MTPHVVPVPEHRPLIGSIRVVVEDEELLYSAGVEWDADA